MIRFVRVALTLLCVTAVVALVFAYAFVHIRSHFSDYDDEGFMLMTLQQYVEGTPLYDKMYTEYGPFYYIAHSTVLSLAGWTVDHDHIRFLSATMWTLVALGWGICVWIWYRSVAWSLTAMFTAAVILRALKWEPGHPQILILLLYACLFIVASLYRKAPDAIVFSSLGAVCAALVLTKINIGVFVSAALAAVFVQGLYAQRAARTPGFVLHACCLAIPALVMHRQFANPEVVVQCAIYTFGIGVVLERLRCHTGPTLAWGDCRWTAMGFFGASLLIILGSLVHGISVSGLVNGVIFQPMRFSGAVPFPAFRPFEYIGLFCSLLAAVLYFHFTIRSPSSIPPHMKFVIAVIVIGLAIGFPRLVSDIAPSFMWILMSGKNGAEQESDLSFATVVVVVVATFSVIMMYPVTETQGYIAASIVVLAVFAALFRNLDGYISFVKRNSIEFVASPQVACGLILIAAIGAGVWSVIAAVDEVAEPAAGHLPQSQLVRLTTEQYRTFSELASYTSSRCDRLVTIPGMNSFHLWSGVPHPNGFTVSAAMVLFDEPMQERLRASFLAASRPCVIFNPQLERWSARYRPARPRQPFVDMVRDDLVRVYSRSGYEIRVPALWR